MTLTLDTIEFGGAADFSQAGKWLERVVRIGAPKYGRSRHYVAGVDGANRKDYGFRVRPLVFECWYVAATFQGVIDAIKSDFDHLAAHVTFTVTTGTTSFANCEMDSEASFHETPRATEGGLFHARAAFAILQTGL
jgi:hypothetical protein